MPLKIIFVPSNTRMNLEEKENIYSLSLKQIRSLLEGERNIIANFSNVSSVLKQNHDFLWVGFYIVENNELVLGPFQGPVACTRISFGKGVCGAAWAEKRTINVSDVHQYPNHITCSESSLSEIVLPVYNKEGNVFAVLDVDSEKLANFDDIDEKYLSQVVKLFIETND